MFSYVEVQLWRQNRYIGGRQGDIYEDIYSREILGNIERYPGRYRDTQRDREIDIKTDSYVLFHQMGFKKERRYNFRKIQSCSTMFTTINLSWTGWFLLYLTAIVYSIQFIIPFVCQSPLAFSDTFSTKRTNAFIEENFPLEKSFKGMVTTALAWRTEVKYLVWKKKAESLIMIVAYCFYLLIITHWSCSKRRKR